MPPPHHAMASISCSLAEVTTAWAEHGFAACPFEIRLNPLADILSTKGHLGYI